MPRVFIGSSGEGANYAQAIFSSIERRTEPTLWTHDLFRPTRTTIENLENVFDAHDAGIFVLTPDDNRVMRNIKGAVPRDNVIFELGMAVARYGRDRTFFVCPSNGKIVLPTDLAGVNYLYYTDRTDGNLRAAVATASSTILTELSSSTTANKSSIRFWDTVQDRHLTYTDPRTLIDKAQSYVFVSGISLRYVVGNCSAQLVRALTRKVCVEILIPMSETDGKFYGLRKRRAHDEIATAHEMWREFADDLKPSARKRISIWGTSLEMCHSLGIYDGAMYVNPFLIGVDSANLPSIRLGSDTRAYQGYLSDALALMQSSNLLAGHGETQLTTLVAR